MTDAYYRAVQRLELVEFGPQPYLTVTGKGAPESEAFLAAVGSLYKRAYAARKLAPEKFTVGKLEGLWWAKEHDKSPREEWNWRLMIRMPVGVSEDAEIIDEGLVLQVLHVGPFSTEPETLERMHTHIIENGLAFNGLHHEVYLSDHRRTAPEKQRTILRQPVMRL